MIDLETNRIEVNTSFSEKQLLITAWLMNESKARTFARRFIPVLFGVFTIVFAVIYRMRANGTVLQVGILAGLGVLCIIRGVLDRKWPIRHAEKAGKINRDLIGRRIRYRFDDEGIESTSFYGTGKIPWKNVKSWGEKADCIFIVVRGGQAIILEEATMKPEELSAIIERLPASEKYEEGKGDKYGFRDQT